MLLIRFSYFPRTAVKLKWITLPSVVREGKAGLDVAKNSRIKEKRCVQLAKEIIFL